MKLLLLESVEGLGRPGDQVDVKPGFARNYLIPQAKAVRVNSDTLRMLGRLQEQAAAEERAMISSMQELADKINGFAVEVSARATEEGHLFGEIEAAVKVTVIPVDAEGLPIEILEPEETEDDDPDEVGGGGDTVENPAGGSAEAATVDA